MTRWASRAGDVISAEGLCMRYRTKDALRDVSFRGRRGETVALLGPNGAGKTTTVEILEGFRRPSAGQVRVLDADPLTAGRRWRARTGIVLQSWRDHGRWRVREFLDYQASYYRPYADGQEPGSRAVGDLLAAVGLDGQARTPIRRLSGGQRRRLDLAIAMAGRPELLFLDEPTAGLDPHARREFHDLLSGIRREAGTTVLMTTHDLDEAEKLASQIIILTAGRITAQGTAAELKDQIAGEDEVRWTRAGLHYRRYTTDSTAFVRQLLADGGEDIRDLEVRRASLEDTYLALVRHAEENRPAAAGSPREDAA
ncbi:MAG: ABC transporter ATP-binding protein [Nocardiopsaceae bacterium]|nr:ABC transporter ATP-binding protein [Nocardiopsaceae bacterium]